MSATVRRPPSSKDRALVLFIFLIYIFFSKIETFFWYRCPWLRQGDPNDKYVGPGWIDTNEWRIARVFFDSSTGTFQNCTT
jgi:hypothetical protein